MNLLCIGDVVGEAGLDCVAQILPALKRELNADAVIVNGENADKSGTGLNRSAAEFLLQYADVVTTGNHALRRATVDLYTDNERLLMPANYPQLPQQVGSCVVDLGRLGQLQVINLAGVAFLEPIDNPFLVADALLKGTQARFTVVDFHAEATAEKKAMGFYLDGRVSAVFGTHTHVQTGDAQVLPKGTGYITDVGMTGPEISVLGVEPALAVEKQKYHRPVQFKVAEGRTMLNGALFVLDNQTGLCTQASTVLQREYVP